MGVSGVKDDDASSHNGNSDSLAAAAVEFV